MTNKEKLFEDINPHTRYWDCHRDEPLEYDHTGKVIKVCKDFSVAFTLFCAENYTLEFWDNRKKWFCRKSGKEKTTEELMKIYLGDDKQNK